MLRSKQQNQPNQDASATSRSRVPGHRSKEHVRPAQARAQAQASRPRPSRPGQGASERGKGLGFLHSLPFLAPNPEAVWGPRGGASGLAGKSQPAGLDLCRQLCQWRGCCAGVGTGRGAAFHSRALASAPAQSSCVALSGTQLTLTPCQQRPCPANPGKALAGRQGCPTSSPGVQPQHQGLMWFQN